MATRPAIIERILSRPAAKPYRSKTIAAQEPFLNADGYLDFHPDDIENPKNWSARRRWYITVVSVLLVVNATFASSSPSGCIEGPNGISEQFKVSAEVAGLVVSVFLLGYCFGPLFWAPLSEFYGRRWIFYISFTAFFALNFLCAFAPNFAALLVGRFLTGVFASSPLSNVPGVLVDIWGPSERGDAMALFSVMTFIGPSLGPVIAGFVELKEDWRWNFYVILWFAGVSGLLMLTIPETYPSQVLINKANRIRRLKIPGFEDIQTTTEANKKTLTAIFKIALTRPWIIMFDPISLMVAIYLSVVYALLYMLFTIYPIVFQQKRGWNAGVGQLPLLGAALGAAIGGLLIFYNTIRERRRIKAGHKPTPEDRLIVAMVGGILFPITMFWFGWSGEYNSVHWIVPTLGGVFLSTAILLIFVAYLNYLTDSYLMFAASALAANTVSRSAAGAAAPLFTQYMFDALGVGGGASLIGGIAALLAPIPFVFYKYGGPIRKRSKFAPTKPDNQKDTPEAVKSETLAAPQASDSSSASSNAFDISTTRHSRLSADESAPASSRESRGLEDRDVEKGVLEGAS